MSAEDKSINITDVELQKMRDFWDDIIRNEDGSLSEAHVYQELLDYRFMLDQVPLVYSYITCQRLSKPHYYADAVIQVAEACADNEIRAVVNDVLDRIEEGEAVHNVRRDFT